MAPPRVCSWPNPGGMMSRTPLAPRGGLAGGVATGGMERAGRPPPLPWLPPAVRPAPAPARPGPGRPAPRPPAVRGRVADAAGPRRMDRMERGRPGPPAAPAPGNSRFTVFPRVRVPDLASRAPAWWRPAFRGSGSAATAAARCCAGPSPARPASTARATAPPSAGMAGGPSGLSGAPGNSRQATRSWPGAARRAGRRRGHGRRLPARAGFPSRSGYAADPPGEPRPAEPARPAASPEAPRAAPASGCFRTCHRLCPVLTALFRELWTVPRIMPALKGDLMIPSICGHLPEYGIRGVVFRETHSRQSGSMAHHSGKIRSPDCSNSTQATQGNYREVRGSRRFRPNTDQWPSRETLKKGQFTIRAPLVTYRKVSKDVQR